MNTVELIYQEAKALPEFMQAEVLDFIGHLNSRRLRALEHPRNADKLAELETFFSSYKMNLTSFKFDREEANAR